MCELEKLEIESIVKIFTYKNVKCVALKQFYYMESSIAAKINLLNASKIETNIDIDQEIEEYERINKIKLHLDQKTAIKERD